MLKRLLTLWFALFLLALPFAVAFEHHDFSCPVAMTAARECPEGPLASASFHLKGLSSLLQTLPADAFTLPLLLTLALFLIPLLLVLDEGTRPSIPVRNSGPPRPPSLYLLAKRKGILERKEDPTRV